VTGQGFTLRFATSVPTCWRSSSQSQAQPVRQL